MKINSFGWTYVGRRDQNQDSLLMLEIDKTRNIYFYAVADGMGGMGGGEVASEIVTETCKKYLGNIFSMQESANLKEVLKEAIIEIDNEILNAIEVNKTLSGMGSTLTCLLIAGDQYVVGNVGDSRTYIMDGKNINQISVDHSYIEEYKQKYEGKVDEAIQKKYGHIVTRSMSGTHDEPDIFPKDRDSYSLMEGTAFMLCSDGLLVNKDNKVTSNFIHQVCIGTKDLKEAVEYLIKLAYHSGSTDNISIIFVEIGNLARNKKIKSPNSFFIEKIPSKNESKPVKSFKVVNFVFIIIIFLGLLFIIYKFSPFNFTEEKKVEVEILKEGVHQKEISTNDQNAIKDKEFEFKSVTITELNLDESTISWNVSGGNDLIYTVEFISDDNQIIEIETKETRLPLKDMKEKGLDKKNYKIQITAISSDKQSTKSDIYERTIK